MNSPSDAYDTPWKDAVTRYFPEFMAFYFHDAWLEIDWTRPYVFLEQELAQVVRDAKLGARRVDKLVRLARHGGAEEWVFVHIDVQGTYDKQFAERVFVYNYRIYDCYQRPVASLALLGDGRAKWKSTFFEYTLFGCTVGIRFPVVKLNDYMPKLEQLMSDTNPFALVTAAHLLTQQTKGRDVERHAAKWRLARMLYERNWDRQRIIDLFNIIDWMMQLPPALQSQLMHDISQLERKRNMPYISSFERKGREEGLREGRLEGGLDLLRDQLCARFGPLPHEVEERLAKAHASQLKAWAIAVLEAPTLDSVFKAR
ncbi:MAG: DUF4351 domain-containing protein [Massilia sp.]